MGIPLYNHNLDRRGVKRSDKAYRMRIPSVDQVGAYRTGRGFKGCGDRVFIPERTYDGGNCDVRDIRRMAMEQKALAFNTLRDNDAAYRLFKELPRSAYTSGCTGGIVRISYHNICGR